jgi:sigma-E factor negative regulatory protein RseB
MKVLISLLLLLNTCFSAIAADSLPAKPTKLTIENSPITTPVSAKLWLERLSTALKTLNFNTSFVVVKNNQAEPYHWFHGIDEDNLELEIFATLNGPRHDILRKGDVVSYIEPEVAPYSIESERISGPIPAILSADISTIENDYEFISVGRSRVLGRVAQLIRIVSKEQDRFGYWLWLDQESGLLLKLAIISLKGQLLEQIQFTHLDITDSLVDTLIQLKQADLPPVIEVPIINQDHELTWQVNWLPTGFKQIKANRHSMSSTNQPVEFILYNDGLVDVSVYVSASDKNKRKVDYVMDGATVVLNQVVNGFEISVVGKIPSNTAKAIANSIGIKATP